MKFRGGEPFGGGAGVKESSRPTSTVKKGTVCISDYLKGDF